MINRGLPIYKAVFAIMFHSVEPTFSPQLGYTSVDRILITKNINDKDFKYENQISTAID